MKTLMIDTHAHIYLPDFDNDREEIIGRAQKEGISAIFLPAIDSSTHEAMLQTEQQYTVCRSMMGLHPCSVKEDYERELQLVEPLIRKFSCRWISKGAIKTIREGLPTTSLWTGVLHFGDGTCDNNAVLVINGEEHQIVLR